MSAPAEARLQDLAAVADIVVTADEERRATAVHLDTRDRRLASWGVSLHHDGEEWVLRLPRPLASTDGAHAERRAGGGPATPPAELRDLVTAFVRTARLVPVARVRIVRRRLTLHTHAGSRLAAVADEELSMLEGGRVAGRRREVELSTSSSAPENLLGALLDRLRATGGEVVEVTRSDRQAGSGPPPELEVASLHRRSAAAEVVRHALAGSVERLIRHDPWIRVGGDVEDVHQARVATRRLRSDLATFAPLLDAAAVEEVRAGLRELGSALGRVRDGDVLLQRLADRVEALATEDRRGAPALLAVLERDLAAARAELLELMRTPAYARLLDRLVALARRPPLVADHPGRLRAADVVGRPLRRLARARRTLSRPPSDAELHELRIRTKRVRYAAEAVAPVAGGRVASLARAAARLQGVLGEHQDAVVAGAWLRDHAGSGAAAYTAGLLAAAETRAARAARSEWRAADRDLRRRRRRGWS